LLKLMRVVALAMMFFVLYVAAAGTGNLFTGGCTGASLRVAQLP